MSLISSSMVLLCCYSYNNNNIIVSDRNWRVKSCYLKNSCSSWSVLSGRRRDRVGGWILNAKRRHLRKKSWWEKFFFDEDGNWFGVKDDEILEEEEEEDDDEDEEDEEISEGEKFEAWRRRAEAIVELREAQDDSRNQDDRSWEDWVVGESDASEWGNNVDDDADVDIVPPKKFSQSVRDLVLGTDDDDLLYQDRVFNYASFNSAKFLAVLIIIPWTLDFLVHDFVLMPFLDRYVKTVPLAAQLLDVRRSQKLEMVKEIKVVKTRYRLEVEIGKSPPLSDTELWLELRHKALELRDKWRLENRRAFANILSDMVFGISLFVLLYLNKKKVALLKFTGYKIINNISDARKAFLIILVTDIFLGYHSECGWQTISEIVLDHYGVEPDESYLTFFIGFVPVAIDACVKLWMFKFLPRFSPNVGNIIKEMKRH